MASTTGGPVRKRIVHHLGSPFTTVSWPEISQEDQDDILELLCEYLGPIGKHRQRCIKTSKGKRAEKKRKRQEKDEGKTTFPMAVDLPAKPETASQVDVGFNSITRGLQDANNEQNADGVVKKGQGYSMVFVCRGNQSAAFNCHFPQMVAASSADAQPGHATRLIGFSKPCSSRLSSCLSLARVSAVAVKSDAAGSCALWDLVKKSVKPVQCEWLDEARSLKYRQTQIVSLEISVGSKKTKVAKLADARALARSFSQTKPPKVKRDSRPGAHFQDRGAQLRGAARSQLTQSIVRPGAFSSASTTSHRQPPRQFHVRRETTISMATWQARKDAPSITGGRGLDFLSRKDALVSIPEVQLAVAPEADLPPNSALTGQTQSLVNAEAPTLVAAGSVLDEFFTLMSQQEKELAQVDPLIDQLQQWHLQSPAVARSNTLAMPATPQPHPSFTGWKKAAVEEIPAATVPNTPVAQSRQTNGQSGSTHVSGVATSEQPSRLPLDEVGNCFSKLRADARLVSLESSKPAVHLPPTPEQKENIRDPAKCNCTPTLKPQKGLSASRFAPKDTENPPSANKFSVNLQIVIHQDFCPMSERHRSVQMTLRASAEPFTPSS
ncbi:hypothetical protein G3M48_008479 [Beauveria asiatica]|uniref:BRCT domain-containing protein n=1 Tax=Beauveria asiatica TaxID=1069075 RepID=A0AAW0S3J8_9HYPO